MCGFAGRINFDSSIPIKREIIEKMTRKLTHRGPDAEGYFVQKNIGLGHRRLKIIDLSNEANQPMYSSDGKIVLVFNGEIYNFLELRKKLEKEYVQFHTHSDTEVLLKLYEKYGEKCLQFLRGMFAFAIWDAKQQKLLIVRDRLGVKPLKFFYDHKKIIFASELKAILEDPEVPREMDIEAIKQYLTFNFVPAPRTGFVGIQKLLPGHFLIWQKGMQEPRIEKYWELDFTQKKVHKEEEWCALLREKFEESVKIRMISDVPLGALLSGGVDSSAIVAAMAKNSTRPIQTFSIGFEEASHNELPFAKIIAEKFHTKHHEFIVRADAVKLLPQLAEIYEEPYADSSAIPSFYLAEKTRQHVTVALNGDGGDENFAGYRWYPIWLRATRTPKFLAKLLPLAKLWPTHNLRRGAETFFHALAETNPFKRYQRFFSYAFFTPEEVDDVIANSSSHDHRNSTSNSSSFDKLRMTNLTTNFHPPRRTISNLQPLDQMLALDIKNFLPDDLLAKMDIATMHHSLETRSPFLDYEFMELTAQIPPELKIKHGEKKYILKKMLEPILPKEILYRKKQGFSIPLAKWLRNELKNIARDLLLNSDLKIFNRSKVEQLLNEHFTGKADHANRIWCLMTLAEWHRKYFIER